MEVNKDSFEENLSKFSPQFSERYNAYLESLEDELHQNSPTSSEETSAEVDLLERMYKMENSNLDEYTITQKVFDTTKLHVGKAYRIINPITGETTDGILESIDFDKLVFGWFYPTDNSWKDFTFGLESIIRIIPLNIEEPNTTVKPEKVISDDLYIRTYSDLADDGCGKYPLFVKDESDKYYIINYDVLSKYMSMKDVVFEISYRAGEHIVGYGVFKPSELYVHVAGTTLTATVKDSTDSRKIKHTLEIRADDMNLFLYVHVNIKRSKEKNNG